jgi:hypothetical protein
MARNYNSFPELRQATNFQLLIKDFGRSLTSSISMKTKAILFGLLQWIKDVINYL